MDSISGEHFHTAIIGAGMSGLAAGIRLAMFDHKVIIIERHNAPGGLNSFYSFDGRKYDVGLHALTNFTQKGAKNTPLTKIIRQLRLSFDDFDLAPQIESRIAFPDLSLRFSNDFELLRTEVQQHFPTQIDSLNRLVSDVESCNETNLYNKPESSRKVLEGYFSETILPEMLLLPIFYYGSSQENDIDWNQFVVMFKAIFLEGFSRPFEGVRSIIKLLTKRYKALGGIRKMKCGVHQIVANQGKVQELILDSGDTITADHVISSIGLPETLRLCSDKEPTAEEDNIGRLSFSETISVLNQQPKDLGLKDTIVFFNDSEKTFYEKPHELISDKSGVICIPNNYQYSDGQYLDEGMFRVSAIANFEKWTQLSEAEYQYQKQHFFKQLQDKALTLMPEAVASIVNKHTIATDMFTPRTIKKYTGHLGGAVYGSTNKVRDGSTHLDNLYLCGTDQGFLGIIGAILSGISMANLHILTKF